ncbi:MAG: transporter substrate-binding domain-containing protein, partial [Candidatus Latescibacteria bacterium]|nr:transporter substrate-binding domain-containing protein [Candidatus Latescibacterota bacterium]
MIKKSIIQYVLLCGFYVLSGWATSFAQAVVLTPEEKQWVEAHPAIQLGSDAYCEPLEFIDEMGVHKGMTADYVALLKERLNLNLVSSPVLPWRVVLEKAQSRDLDVLTCAASTPQREQYLKFTKPYLNCPIVVFARWDATPLTDLNNLMDVPVGVVNGYAHHELLERDFPQLNLQPVGSVQEGLEKLIAGEIDAYVGFLIVADHVIRQNKWHNIKIAGGTPYSFSLRMGVRSDWPELVDILNKGIDSVTPEDHARISKTWLTVEYEEGLSSEVIWKIFLWILGIGILVALIVVLWTRQVRKGEARLRGVQVELEASLRQQAALLRIDRAIQGITHSRDLEGLVHLLVEQLQLLNIPMGSLALHRVIDESDKVFETYQILPTGEISHVENRLMGPFRMWKAGQTSYRPDLDADAQGLSQENRAKLEARLGMSVRSILDVPHIRGTLALLSSEPKAFTEDQIRFVEQVTEVVSV